MAPTQVVKLMCDYDAFPLWVSSGRLGQASSRSVPISDDLASDLQAWSDNMSSLMWAHHGPERHVPDPDELSVLNSEGQSLAQRVRVELTDEWAVRYFDECSGEVVEVAAAPRPVRSRHGR